MYYHVGPMHVPILLGKLAFPSAWDILPPTISHGRLLLVIPVSGQKRSQKGEGKREFFSRDDDIYIET